MSEQETPNDDELSAALNQRWETKLNNLLDPTPQEVKAGLSGGCPRCLEIGSNWVHLRMCMVCGEIGCCDSSPQTHAHFHWEQSKHAVIRSLEPDEKWKFSYELNGYLT
jgi:hypothetical protein